MNDPENILQHQLLNFMLDQSRSYKFGSQIRFSHQVDSYKHELDAACVQIRKANIEQSFGWQSVGHLDGEADTLGSDLLHAIEQSSDKLRTEDRISSAYRSVWSQIIYTNIIS